MSEEEKTFQLVFDGTQRADILTYTVTSGIQRSRHYHFKVAAMNYVGISEDSPILTSLAAVVPSTPISFTIETSGEGSVTVSWLAPDQDGGSSVIGYYIYYKITGSSDSWSKTQLVSYGLNFH